MQRILPGGTRMRIEYTAISPTLLYTRAGDQTWGRKNLAYT